MILAQAVMLSTLAAQDQPVIRANAPLVLIPAAVTDRKGRPIEGLMAGDFAVTDDGAPQQIEIDTSDAGLAPVRVVVAVESNGISEPALARIRRVGPMIQPLIAGERGRAAVIAFDEEVRTLQDFTGDSTKIRDALAGVRPGSVKTAKLLDAVASGVRMLREHPENSRRILVIFGESRDRGSVVKLAAVLEAAQRSGVAIYPATYSVQGSSWISKQQSPEGPADWAAIFTEPARLAKVNDADAMAAATGGRHLSFLTLRSLEKAVSEASEEIHSQYLLSFAPRGNGNAGFHRVAVTLPAHKDAVIRARPGYWPEP